MSDFERIDRRLFLRGLTLTSAGLVVPRAFISIPKAWTPCYAQVTLKAGGVPVHGRAIISMKGPDEMRALLKRLSRR